MVKRAQRGIGKPAMALLSRMGRHDPPADVVVDGATTAAAAILLAAGLAERRPGGGLEISDAGRAHLARAVHHESSDHIGPFRAQHLRLGAVEIDTPVGRDRLTVDLAESPLAWLARRKGRDGRAMIEPAQLQAGERLRADFTRAQLMPHITANWSNPTGQDGRSGALTINLTERIVMARQQVRQALDTVGPEFSGLLVDVCCFLRGLEDVERTRGWPRSSAKVVLQLGLDRLARHYGYETKACGAPRAPMRAWLADDIRFPGGE